MQNKYKPILCNSEVIPGIIDGIKTQTRRVQNISGKPAYEIGDILYVRETVRIGAWNEGYAAFAFDYKASPSLIKTPFIEFPVSKHFKMLSKVLSKLDSLGVKSHTWTPGKSPLPWIPSIHMPKEAARIFLEVINVREEKLSDISDDDVIAEGIEPIKVVGLGDPYFIFPNHLPGDDFLSFSEYTWNYGKEIHSAAKASFCSFWEVYIKEGQWNENPKVWVYEFKVIKKPADFGIN